MITSLPTQHLVHHERHPGLKSDSTLHVIGVVSNPERFQTRWRYSRLWLERMAATANVKPYIVEAAFGDRHHEVAEENKANHLQLRTNSQCWIKESMINLGARHLLPKDWKYVAWVDTDITFRDPDWALECIHQLQHFPIIQPWQTAVDLGPKGNAIRMKTSFGYDFQQHVHQQKKWEFNINGGSNDRNGHTGYAWACTRQFYERVGGLIDYAILGSGDWHMAYACVGEADKSLHHDHNGGFRRKIREWQDKAVTLTHKEVGFSAGHIEHSFHGSYGNRQYDTRWKVLLEHQYDPDTDVMWDEQGLVTLRGNKPLLERAIRTYNRIRQEDDIRDEP